MIKKQEIILKHFRDGKSKREIAKETELDWKTVDKYIKQYQESQHALSSIADKKELADEIVAPPKYNVSNRKRRKVTPEIQAEIQRCLEGNKLKKGQGRRKQVMKKIDIYEHLKKEKYDIGYTTVSELIKELTNSGREAFIKQIYSPGDVCEFDWGEVHLTINGVSEKLYMAVFTSAYSNYRYVRLFRRHDSVAFKQSHALFFEHIGKVFKTMVYDNDSVAVKRFVGKNEKEATEALMQMSIYYLFDYRFCNVRSGNEKGHVERSVEYVRRKAFCQTDMFDSLEAVNDHLFNALIDINNTPLKQAENKTPSELLTEEYGNMVPSAPPFESAEISENRVDKYSTISMFQNRYSVPEKYVGDIITVKSYSDEIICYNKREKICSHERSYAANNWSIKIEHYLTTLRKKPGALVGSSAFKQAPLKLQDIYHNHYMQNQKDFMELLLYMKTKEHSLSEIESVIKELQKGGNRTISTDKIKTILERNPIPENNVDIYSDQITEAAKLQLCDYDKLFTQAFVQTVVQRGGNS